MKKQPTTFLSEKEYSVGFTRIDLDGHTYFIPDYAAHRPACMRFLKGYIYEHKTHAMVSTLLPRMGGSIVHAGTFFGDMLPSFSKACRSKVYAFEPVLENYILAKICLEKNGLDNVMMFNAALSDTTGTGFIQVQSEDEGHLGGGSSVAQQGQRTTLMQLDALKLDDVSIMHLDVEGHEMAAVKGAQETIRRCNPIMLVEDNNDKCKHVLRPMGYEVALRVTPITIWALPQHKRYFEDNFV